MNQRLRGVKRPCRIDIANLDAAFADRESVALKSNAMLGQRGKEGDHLIPVGVGSLAGKANSLAYQRSKPLDDQLAPQAAAPIEDQGALRGRERRVLERRQLLRIGKKSRRRGGVAGEQGESCGDEARSGERHVVDCNAFGRGLSPHATRPSPSSQPPSARCSDLQTLPGLTLIIRTGFPINAELTIMIMRSGASLPER